MDKKEFNLKKELIELSHKYRMEEVESERKARIETETLRFNNQMSIHRLKRADVRRAIESKGRRY